jgi:hypothetical protein
MLAQAPLVTPLESLRLAREYLELVLACPVPMRMVRGHMHRLIGEAALEGGLADRGSHRAPCLPVPCKCVRQFQTCSHHACCTHTHTGAHACAYTTHTNTNTNTSPPGARTFLAPTAAAAAAAAAAPPGEWLAEYVDLRAQVNLNKVTVELYLKVVDAIMDRVAASGRDRPVPALSATELAAMERAAAKQVLTMRGKPHAERRRGGCGGPRALLRMPRGCPGRPAWASLTRPSGSLCKEACLQLPASCVHALAEPIHCNVPGAPQRGRPAV